MTVLGIVVLAIAGGIGWYIRKLMREETDQAEEEEGGTAV
jgi:hypothetical protein